LERKVCLPKGSLGFCSHLGQSWHQNLQEVAVREKSAATAITGLKDRDGSVITDHRGLNRITSSFYRLLYDGGEMTLAQQVALDDLIALIPQRFNHLAQEQLNAP
jgi:hypothetical protein